MTMCSRIRNFSDGMKDFSEICAPKSFDFLWICIPGVRSAPPQTSAESRSQPTQTILFKIPPFLLSPGKGCGTMSCTGSWLPAFVAANRFFTPCAKCSVHHSSREATLNFWDVVEQHELCSVCVTDSPRENVIQVGPTDALILLPRIKWAPAFCLLFSRKHFSSPHAA